MPDMKRLHILNYHCVLRISKKVYSKAVKRFRISGFILLHKVINIIFQKKPRHVIITGPSRSGKTVLYNLLRATISQNCLFPKQETAALNTIQYFSRLVVSERSLDLMDYHNILQKLGKIRSIKFIILIRDPQELLCQKKDFFANQYWHGYDYQLHTPGRKYVSFSDPGIITFFRKIEELCQANKENIMLVRFEELINNPQKIQQQISSFCSISFNLGFDMVRADDMPNDYQTNEIKNFKSLKDIQVSSLTNDAHINRVLLQLQLCPELEKTITAFGYNLETKRNNTLVKNINSGCVISKKPGGRFNKTEYSCLIDSSEKLNLTYAIDKNTDYNESTDSANCLSGYLLNKRRSIKGALLYIKIKSIVHADPWIYLQNYDGDIAVYVNRKGEVKDSTIFINDTKGAFSILEEWHKKCLESDTINPVVVLQKIVDENVTNNSSNYSIQRLPVNLSYERNNESKYFFGEPIIEHITP